MMIKVEELLRHPCKITSPFELLNFVLLEFKSTDPLQPTTYQIAKK